MICVELIYFLCDLLFAVGRIGFMIPAVLSASYWCEQNHDLIMDLAVNYSFYTRTRCVSCVFGQRRVPIDAKIIQSAFLPQVAQARVWLSEYR